VSELVKTNKKNSLVVQSGQQDSYSSGAFRGSLPRNPYIGTFGSRVPPRLIAANGPSPVTTSKNKSRMQARIRTRCE